jgi:hypothetical protein
MQIKSDLQIFIENMERSYFRTNEDTGANLNALFIWNLVREYAKMEKLAWEDLPAHCKVHNTYHVIKEDYGCVRTKEKY